MKIEFKLDGRKNPGEYFFDGNSKLRTNHFQGDRSAIVIPGKKFDYKKLNFPERLYKIIGWIER
jgi:hypothetical protein